MLIKQPQIRIASKEIILATGEAVRAFFALITIEGHTEVRFLGTKPIEATKADFEAPIALLEGVCSTCFGEVSPFEFTSVSSPFNSLDLLVNQLARAHRLRNRFVRLFAVYKR